MPSRRCVYTIIYTKRQLCLYYFFLYIPLLVKYKICHPRAHSRKRGQINDNSIVVYSGGSACWKEFLRGYLRGPAGSAHQHQALGPLLLLLCVCIICESEAYNYPLIQLYYIRVCVCAIHIGNNSLIQTVRNLPVSRLHQQ